MLADSNAPCIVITNMEHLCSEVPKLSTDSDGNVFYDGKFIGLWEPNLQDESGDSITLLLPSKFYLEHVL